ncbi:MAG: AzlC family ABC transporter permease [Proteobacteria bacterium]|nr:AzlC family ABC transporter permease [Pseudomonadota bacterium]
MVPFYKKLNPLRKMVRAFGLTDETFAAAVRCYHQKDGVPGKHYYNLGSMVFMYLNWNLCTFIGSRREKRFRRYPGGGLILQCPPHSLAL